MMEGWFRRETARPVNWRGAMSTWTVGPNSARASFGSAWPLSRGHGADASIGEPMPRRVHSRRSYRAGTPRLVINRQKQYA